MGTQPTRQVYIRFESKASGEPLAPPELRPRLVADAAEQGSNLKDVIVRILSDHHRVPFEPVGRKTAPSTTGPLTIKVPTRLFQKIAVAAAAADVSPQQQIIATLSAHYGLEPVAAAA